MSIHTANVYVKNGTSKNAYIQMSHICAGLPVESGEWYAGPNETVGPLVVNFDKSELDWWWASIAIDGEGIFESEGCLTDPQKECQLQSKDENKDITNIVTTTTFSINLPSGGCSTGMKYVAPYAKIPHVFVLMLENHSFDHLLGFSSITGTDTSTGLSTKVNGIYDDGYTNSYDGSTYHTANCAIDPMTTDPGHEFLDTLEQLCGEGTVNPFPKGPYPAINNSGFIANYATSTTEGPVPVVAHRGDVLACCTSYDQVPVLYQLATEFAVCDNWFSSMPGPTWPNRFFAMGASSGGLDDSPSSGDIAKWVTIDGFTYANGSLFDRLDANEVHYKLYYDRTNQFSGLPPTRLGSVPIAAALNNITIYSFSFFDSFADDLQRNYPYGLTFIEPNYGDVSDDTYTGGSSQHPMDSLAAGEAMIAATYNAIRNSPVWNNSLLIITYDEHGGYFDHVAPGKATPPGDKQDDDLNKHGFDFSNYGVRVPAVIVSPRIPKNTIDHTLYDHSSISKTMVGLYGFDPLTDRDRDANDLLHLVSLTTPRTDCPEKITAPVPSAASGAAKRSTDEKLYSAPLPEKGNLIGFLQVALKGEIDMSDGSEQTKQEIISKFKDIKTRGAARDYIQRISEMAGNFRKDSKS